MGGENPPLFELFFEITVSLCKEFPSLNPVTIRKEKAHEIFLLMGRMAKYNRKQKKQKGKPQKIYRPAGDTWF